MILAGSVQQSQVWGGTTALFSAKARLTMATRAAEVLWACAISCSNLLKLMLRLYACACWLGWHAPDI